METEKLYYADPFLKEFTATVLDCQAGKNGYTVTLDRTAFYPQIPAVIAAVQDGTLDESVIDNACLRVLRCKDTFLRIPENNP